METDWCILTTAQDAKTEILGEADETDPGIETRAFIARQARNSPCPVEAGFKHFRTKELT